MKMLFKVGVKNLYDFLWIPVATTTVLVDELDIGSHWCVHVYQLILTWETPNYLQNIWFSFHLVPPTYYSEWGNFYNELDPATME